MSIKTIFGLTAVGALCLSCQSNVYQINGFARDYNEGDTICMRLEADGGRPVAMTRIAEGKFSFRGEIDDTAFCMIYPKNSPKSMVSLFLEPSQIAVELSLSPERNRVSGTILNNVWQQLNDSIRLMGQEVVRRSQQPVADSTTQWQQVKAIDSLHRRMSDCILSTARRNNDNPVGQYINQHYKAPEFK